MTEFAVESMSEEENDSDLEVIYNLKLKKIWCELHV